MPKSRYQPLTAIPATGTGSRSARLTLQWRQAEKTETSSAMSDRRGMLPRRWQDLLLGGGSPSPCLPLQPPSPSRPFVPNFALPACAPALARLTRCNAAAAPSPAVCCSKSAGAGFGADQAADPSNCAPAPRAAAPQCGRGARAVQRRQGRRALHNTDHAAQRRARTQTPAHAPVGPGPSPAVSLACAPLQ